MNGLFFGLSTVDIVHYVERDPQANEKATALSTCVFCGGPAANAAITFARLGGRAEFISWVGTHPVAAVVHDELAQYGVVLHDLQNLNGAAESQHSGAQTAAQNGDDGRTRQDEPPVVASAIVNVSNGDRTVVGVKPQAQREVRTALPEPSARPDVVLLDSYFNAQARSYALWARRNGVPVVLDGGSWKESLPDVLPLVDYAICSERFRAPGCDTTHATARFLFAQGVAVVCFTRGEKPILVFERGLHGTPEDNQSSDLRHAERFVDVPAVTAVRDTLAAGDIFHGAFCYYLVHGKGNLDAVLSRAAEVAARSVQVHGPRNW